MEVEKLKNQPRLLVEIFCQNVKRVRQLIADKDDVNWQDSEGRSLLFAAAFVGNGDIADALILSGARVNKKDQRWNTPLGYACRYHNAEVVELLLIHNAEVNSRNRNWQVPLHICAANNSIRCAEYLLPSIASEVDISDRQGRTAAHWACHSGSVEMIQLLVENGAKLNVADKMNRRPLHYACQRGDVDLVEFLLLQGVDTAVTDQNGHRPIAYAAAPGNDGVVKAILDFEIDKFGSPTSLHHSTKERGECLLHLTVANGQMIVIEMLLSYGADVDCRSRTNLITPLMIACSSAKGSNCVSSLLHNGANPKLKSADGFTPLHFMAANDIPLIPTLVKSGGDVNAVNNRGFTPLHIASFHGHSTCVRQLLDLQANVNCVSENGQTPLHLSAIDGHDDVVTLLLECGADVCLEDNFGRSALHYACMGGKVSWQTVEQLIDKGADVFGLDCHNRSSLHYAAFSGNDVILELLIERHVEIQIRDTMGRQPLHYAAHSDYNSKCCDLLLKHGADPRAPDQIGFTPTFYACVSGHPVTAELFLKISGHYELERPKRIKCSISALHIAAHAGHPKTVLLLLNYGAPVDIQTDDGQTPLMMAVRRNNLACIKHLVNAGANVWQADFKRQLNAVHLAASLGLTDTLRILVADCHPSLMSPSEGLQLTDRVNRDALMLAVSARSLEAAIYLITQGSLATHSDQLGRSALHRAAALGQDRICEILIEKGAQIMAATNAGRTAFHLCCQRSESRVLSVLLKHTPDDRNTFPTWQDSRGFTPLHWAAYSGSETCVELLLWELKTTARSGLSPFSFLHCAAASGSQICLQLLLEAGCEELINSVDRSGRSPLHVAAQSGSLQSVQLLCKVNADRDVQDRVGRTALMVAVNGGFEQIVEFLLKMGADVTLTDIRGDSCLHHACKQRVENVANLLITDGPIGSSWLNKQNSDMRTALHIAARHGMVSTVEQLLLKGSDLYLRDKNDFTPALACAIDENVADCLALIMTVQNLETLNTTPTPTTLAPTLSAGRLSFSHSQLTELLKKGRSRGSDPVIVPKETNSAHSSDSEFY